MSANKLPSIRQACVADAAALAQLADKTFRATFAHGNSAADMAAHCQASYGPAIQRAEIARPDWITLVADDGDALVAYAQLRWSERPAAIRGRHPGEILRFYLDAPWHGSGLADGLMARCLAELRQRDSHTAWLGVWEHNPRAIRFYARHGFREVGDHVFTVGCDRQRDILMARTLVAHAD